jgi:hypothetical protein
MNKHLRNFCVLGVFLIIFGCAASAFGQIRTGGYKSASVADAGVKAAADFAIELKSADYDAEIRIENILKAETQTVAGTNYRLCLEIYVPSETDGEDGVALIVQTVVYRNLQGEMKITSWNDESDCGGN